MYTRTRADISRENGAKSRGPKNPEGKARSSMNALKHGLTARNVAVLREESEAEFDELFNSYVADYQPQNDAECDLVSQMVVSRWNLLRIQGMFCSTLDVEIDRTRPDFDKEFTHGDTMVRAALAFRNLADNSNTLQLLARYETSHSRAYYRALNTLLRMRSNPPLRNEPGNPLPPPSASSAPLRSTTPPAPPTHTPQPTTQITKRTQQVPENTQGLFPASVSSVPLRKQRVTVSGGQDGAVPPQARAARLAPLWFQDRLSCTVSQTHSLPPLRLQEG